MNPVTNTRSSASNITSELDQKKPTKNIWSPVFTHQGIYTTRYGTSPDIVKAAASCQDRHDVQLLAYLSLFLEWNPANRSVVESGVQLLRNYVRMRAYNIFSEISLTADSGRVFWQSRRCYSVEQTWMHSSHCVVTSSDTDLKSLKKGGKEKKS